MRLAVVKPDHLGDLILSSSAIRAIHARYSDMTLLVASQNMRLARLLFPGINIRLFDLPHLTKGGQSARCESELGEFDLVLFLRNDQVLNPQRMQTRCTDFMFFAADDKHHQTMLDYSVVMRVVGAYDIDALFYLGRDKTIIQKVQQAPQRIGLCIGAGFYANAWPAAHWVALGRVLQSQGKEVAVICGPSEVKLGGMICRALGLEADEFIAGDDDYPRFLERVAGLDWVVASDGGTAHLCSLVTPLVSIFGGSPFRRYAPFGRWNRLLTLELPCSPCCQYMSRAINGCLSTECVVDITPDLVLEALETLDENIAPSSVAIGRGCHLYFGVSHLDRLGTDAL